jgi:membrane dipeptidase
MNDSVHAEHAAELVSSSLVWDNTFPFGASCGAPAAHARMLERMRAVGYGCVSLTMATDPQNMQETVRKIAADNAFFRRHADRFTTVASVADIEAARRDGTLAIVYSFQGTTPFERDLSLIDLFYGLGVRQALMAYNQKNFVGDGCHERTDAGLSRFGVQVVQEMNRVGMIVDCTHTGYRTTMDVFEVALGPVVFSHSNARALVDHERNIRDEQADACARTSGVVGVNGVGVFLGDNDPSPDRLFAHIDHFVQRIGARHVGFGIDVVSDKAPLMAIVAADAARYPATSGYNTEVEFGWPELIPEATERMLRAGYADDDVKAILGGNWLRVATEVWRPVP